MKSTLNYLRNEFLILEVYHRIKNNNKPSSFIII